MSWYSVCKISKAEGWLLYDDGVIRGRVLTPLGMVYVIANERLKFVLLETVIHGQHVQERFDYAPSKYPTKTGMARIAHRWLKGL